MDKLKVEEGGRRDKRGNKVSRMHGPGRVQQRYWAVNIFDSIYKRQACYSIPIVCT